MIVRTCGDSTSGHTMVSPVTDNLMYSILCTTLNWAFTYSNSNCESSHLFYSPSPPPPSFDNCLYLPGCWPSSASALYQFQPFLHLKTSNVIFFLNKILPLKECMYNFAKTGVGSSLSGVWNKRTGWCVDVWFVLCWSRMLIWTVRSDQSDMNINPSLYCFTLILCLSAVIYCLC